MSAQPLPLHLIRTVHLALAVTDPEVVAELERRTEGAERHDFAGHAIRIGVLALRHAAGALDVDSIRRAGDDVVASVRNAVIQHATEMNDRIGKVVAQYFDPSSGSLPQRIEQLVKGDGDLERLLVKHLDGDRSTIHRTLGSVLGEGSTLLKLLSPEQAGGVVASTKVAVDALPEAAARRGAQAVLTRREGLSTPHVSSRRITTANAKLRAELTQDVDKVVKEFSLDNEDGALSRLVGQLDQAQATIVEQLSLDPRGLRRSTACRACSTRRTRPSRRA